MDFFRVKMKMKSAQVAVVLLACFALCSEAYKQAEYVLDSAASSHWQPHIVTLGQSRQKRDVPQSPPSPAAPAAGVPPAGLPPVGVPPGTGVPASPAAPAPAPVPPLAPAPVPVNQTGSQPSPAAVNATAESNRTTNVTKAVTDPPATVTQVPILGANGTGQRWTNLTENTPKVSDPIPADDNLTDVFETPERIQADRHVGNLTYDNHSFYNSSFIGDLDYFKQYWANISKPTADVHSMLSNSHRRATTVKLKFLFPFYGNWIQSITVATGGFIYTGEHTHAWLAATQYIAPLMANFDTSLNNDSSVKLADDGEKFTAFWENVTLREEPQKKFTFAVTLHKNGDIVFAYKNIPMLVEDIDDSAHPVKIGISDAYLTDKIIFYVRRKTIYEYHRVSFKHYEITNNTILRLVALPTCLQYDTCDTCLNHNTSFECAWCEAINKCSSGTDRNKQDWQLRSCDRTLVTNSSQCPARVTVDPRPQDGSTAYVTDTKSVPFHEAVVNNLPVPPPESPKDSSPPVGQTELKQASGQQAGVGGVVAALLAVALVCAAAAWALYAFKNPHTTSGQLLIKYRPSQWNWRRGEARYTAATIHM